LDFDIDNVNIMDGMFDDCQSIKKLKIKNNLYEKQKNKINSNVEIIFTSKVHHFKSKYLEKYKYL